MIAAAEYVKSTGSNELEPLGGEAFKIGFLSRIHPKKGLDLLIQALSNVEFRYELRIAGECEPKYLEKLKELIIACGIDANLQWVGWKNGKEKFEFLSQLDLFALTSHSENFALTVIEALSVGTPVLISNQIGIYDYVLQKDLGWVCDVNVDSIAASLKAAHRDAGKRNRIRSTATETVHRDYDESRLADQYVQYYEELSSTS